MADRVTDAVRTGRATRNSDSGNREHGGFGPVNAAYIESIQSGGTSYTNFGDFLDAWVNAYC